MAGNVFDIHQFDQYREGNRLEVKKAEGSLPVSMWETYSSMANTNGGFIILGVGERADGSFYTTGLKDPQKVIKNFWNTINDRKKVSVNLLTDSDVTLYELNGDVIVAIHVPRARREDKPVYINDNLFGGTYRRNGEGDYHCTQGEVKAMLRDQPEATSDMKVLDERELTDMNMDTVHAYRSRHEAVRPEHVWSHLTDAEYLEQIGAARISSQDHKLHPTGAGLLMFGNDYKILYEYPEYFLDYREVLDPTIRWTDRLQSDSGDWSGNLFDFYFRVISKLTKDLKIPFVLDGITRVEDTPVHKALREALANCLVNTDFYLPRGVVIRKDPEKIIFENPGYIRTGKEQMLRGGVSDPRNKALMKMFNLIGIGERAGSGVPDILSVWRTEGWSAPEVKEQFNPDRTFLTLPLIAGGVENGKQGDKNEQIKQADKNEQIKQADKNKQIKRVDKTSNNEDKIIYYLNTHGASKAKEIADYLGLSSARTRVLLRDLSRVNKIEAMGEARARRYLIKNQ